MAELLDTQLFAAYLMNEVICFRQTISQPHFALTLSPALKP
jgi:hypothetical protein